MHDLQSLNIGPYHGALAEAFNCPSVLSQLSELSTILSTAKVERLSHGADYVVRLPLFVGDRELPITVKVFKPQGRLKDWYDRKNGSKAERSFRAATYLQQHKIGTPAPIAWLDRWENNRLLESYYLCVYESATCFRDALLDIYHNQRDSAPLMELLNLIAPAVKAMHDAGFMHADMGNQNILLPQDQQGNWLAPLFIDLNRSKYSHTPLNADQRGADISRLILPGAYLNFFKQIYCGHQDIPQDINQAENRHRRRFERHRRTRAWRKPFSHWHRKRKNLIQPTYPEPKDLWLWDEKTAQPMIALDKREKNKNRSLASMISMVCKSLWAAPGILSLYKEILSGSYSQPRTMTNRIGVALHPRADYLNHELALLKELGNPPVLIRFCHHESPDLWQLGMDTVENLHAQGVEVMIALLQDRQAVLEPIKWKKFLTLIISTLADKVSHIEITHATNRVKWGVWNFAEFSQLLAPAFELKQQYPKIKLTGPACIDFEYASVIAALSAVPGDQKFDAISHLLYVDRRGAPENKQGKYSTLEKCALLKAIAQRSSASEDQVIISEVNWPIKHTGIWSPIICPYETPKWRRIQPGETEETYANYLVRYLLITLCSGHADRVYWWRLSAYGYGLVDDCDDFRIRPAFTALRQLLKTIGNARFVRKLPTLESRYLLEFERDNSSIYVAWSTQTTTESITEVNADHVMNIEGNPLQSALWTEAPVYLFQHG